MTDQLSLFDPARSEAEKDRGRDLAATSREELLKIARSLAVNLARQHGSITADDVTRALVLCGYDLHALGNAAGSLFRGPGWRHTGEMRKSQRVHRHSGLLRVWRYEE